jgi:hypothetical protein
MLTEWPGIGSIRRYRDTLFEISSGPRSVPSSFLQEHAGNSTSHQRLEVGARSEVPRECSGAQGGCANETVCWRYWPRCTGYVGIKLRMEWPTGGADYVARLQANSSVSLEHVGQSSRPNSSSAFSRMQRQTRILRASTLAT